MAILFSVLWLAACGREEPARDGSRYSIKVAGDAQATLVSPKDHGRFTREKHGGAAVSYVLWFGSRENDFIVSAIFNQPEPPESGSYALTSALSKDKPVSGMVLDKRQKSRSFVTEAGAGTVEITRGANNTYSGSFRFAAAESGPGKPGGKVSVEGKFKDVPLRGLP
jgi:hypothetical protein